jgi:hypothetical protein
MCVCKHEVNKKAVGQQHEWSRNFLQKIPDKLITWKLKMKLVFKTLFIEHETLNNTHSEGVILEFLHVV